MRRFIAALSAVALLSASVPALAGGHRHYGHHYKSYGHGHYKYGHYKRGHHGHGYGGAVVVGALVGGLVLGHLLTRPAYYAPPPRPYYAPPPRPALGNCLPTTGTGYLYGRPALYGGTMCYDPYGRAYILRGSEHFIGYLR